MKWTTDGIELDSFDEVINQYYDAFKLSNPDYNTLSFARFKASEEYEQFYTSAQIDMDLQDKTTQIFDNVVQYINDTSLTIQSPSTVYTTVADNIESEFGFEASAKAISAAEAGNAFIAIDYEPEATLNQSIAQFLMNKCIVAGVITDGDIAEMVTLSNGQQFEYKWTTAKRQDIKFRMTVTVSRNADVSVDDKEVIVEKMLTNYANAYRMGMDIEPERYFEVNRDAPYAANIETEYTLDGGVNWSSEPLVSAFDTKFIPKFLFDDVEIERV
jgi:hypothetical protein